ncbi:MAG TPA: hypothetical protein VLF62_02080 [Candidatus Saccharimonadales bacterium]|nr:hypothetical protein [Candidatus Saccharimonadales bacterium]
MSSTSPSRHSKQTIPGWQQDARDHAWDYLTRFAFNPGVEKVVGQYDSHFKTLKTVDDRLDYLKKLAGEHWDFRKGRERFEITETYEMDEPGNETGKIIFEGAAILEMGTSSRATLKKYSIMAVLGGANMGPYYRLRYALEQNVEYGMLAYLGSERALADPEKEITSMYARGAQTEFDLGKGAITSLMNDKLTDDGVNEYDVFTSEWHITRLQQKDGVPVVLLSSPPFLGGKRANTADTYDFMRRLEQETFTPTENILFTTGSLYRYAQYFDAMREICLRTGVDIEIIGFDPPYSGMEFKPTQFLQELKAAADAAIRLRDACKGNENRNEWRQKYYNRFTRDESMRPEKN